MFEKNRLIHTDAQRGSRHKKSYARVDPNAEIASAFYNHAISRVDDGDTDPPVLKKSQEGAEG